jgi:hypothetical protein
MPASAQQTVSAPKGDHPEYLTVSQWGDHFSWPPKGGLRHLIFNAERNGFKRAIKRVGRRVLIDTQKFWEIVGEQGDG